MTKKRLTKIRFVKLIFGGVFAVINLLGVVAPSAGVMAEDYNNTVGQNLQAAEMTEVVTPSESEDASDTGVQNGVAENDTQTDDVQTTVEQNANAAPVTDNKSCKESMGAIGWLVCPATGVIAKAVDWLYDRIESVLVINPVEMKDGAPIYEIWKYMRGITNVLFIIFLLVMVYSQVTGLGITNYGLKKTLPKLIVGAILVNLSFIMCSLAVDASNIVGNGLRGMFEAIELNTVGSASVSNVTVSQMYSALGGVAGVGVLGGALVLEAGTLWMLIPTVLGALAAVVIGLVTIALRQAVVALLIMIAPLAVMAYILPNTEQWFKKWRHLLFQMLVFYPMFSLLFGASSLAGFAIIASARDGFMMCLGIAVQIFPLFFAWSLMRMSGTFLSGINAKLSALAAKPIAVNRAWAESRRDLSRAYHLQYGMTPSSHLRRYLDNRRALREDTTARLQGYRKNDANVYVQRKISAGYDGTKALGTSAYLKPNKYTRIAKDFSNSNLASETATMDTKHTISEYGNYFTDRKTRKLISALNKQAKSKDETKANAARAQLERLQTSNPDALRAATGAHNYLEYTRAKMTEENDSESDFNYMVDQYLDASLNYDANDSRMISDAERKRRAEKYRHFIMSSAGGLGEVGQVRVLGKIIAQASAVESSQRRDINIVAAKFPPNKSVFRDMIVGYYVNDDGYATDKNGNVIEEFRGQLLKNDPDKLVLWDQVDENGPYYDWYDTNGNYVTRIYKRDKSAIKELLSNFDTTINDPINNLYGILAGIKEGDVQGESENLKYIGLDSFRTTVGRAILNAPFKEKNAAFSPMVAEMVNKGYIQNYAQEYLAYLDSFNKATKPGAFNVQDADAIAMFRTMMDPDNWNEIFRKDLVEGFRNVNGKPLVGIRVDENGNRTEVPAAEATQEELLTKIKEKFIFPAAHKIIANMARQTQNTSDNQKAGTIEEWKKLKDVFDKKWGGGTEPVVEENPYKQAGDMRSMAWDIQDELYTEDENGKKIFVSKRRRNTSVNGGGTSGGTGGGASVDGAGGDVSGNRTDMAGARGGASSDRHTDFDDRYEESGRGMRKMDHDRNIRDIAERCPGDAEFEREFGEYCARYPELSDVWNEFEVTLNALRLEYRRIDPLMLYDVVAELLDRHFPLD